MITEELAREVGDESFPLEVFASSPDTSHDHVGLEAEVSPRAGEALKGLHGRVGEIIGVYTKSGQIAGYKVKIGGDTYIAPKKDFYVGERGFVEDVYVDTDRAQHVKRVLNHFSTQHDYVGPVWHGVELFCYQLAKAADRCGIESAGWYEYKHSTRGTMDGKDWRYVVEDYGDKSVIVNCHSVLHDNVWTLSTTIYSTTEADTSRLKFIGHDNIWIRALLWTFQSARLLEESGFDYSDPIRKYRRRIRQSAWAQSVADPIMERAGQIYNRITAKQPSTGADFGVSSIFVPPGKIAEHRSPTNEVPHSVVTISPDAFDEGIAKQVVKHEAVHAVINDRSERPHGKLFRRIASEIGLKDKHMD